MTVIASNDEEFANRCWNRNSCEYLREEVLRVPWPFFFFVVYCDGIPNQEKRKIKGKGTILLRKKA
jgi:hypothetical protein